MDEQSCSCFGRIDAGRGSNKGEELGGRVDEAGVEDAETERGLGFASVG